MFIHSWFLEVPGYGAGNDKQTIFCKSDASIWNLKLKISERVAKTFREFDRYVPKIIT